MSTDPLKIAERHCRDFFVPGRTVTRKVLSSTRLLYLGTGMTAEGAECPACVMYVLHAGELHFMAFNAPHVPEQFWHANGSVH